MAEQADNANRSSGALGIVVALVMLALLPLLYVLSVGPVAMMYPQDPPDWAKVVYAPLFWLAETSKVAENILEWYVRLWGAGP